MATSSALKLGDIALSIADGVMDMSLIDSDIASDLSMQTACALSLFTDRRATDDDVPPSGDANDRRGWWADEFLEVEGDRYGSRLWLLDRSKRTNETALLAEEYAQEALAWMIEDKVASSIDVAVEFGGADRILIGVTIQRPDRTAISFKFSHVWSDIT